MFVFQVLASKEAHTQGLKRRLGITVWREFSEDMTQGLKNLQISQASPARLYAWLSCKFFKPCVMSSLNSRHLVMPRRRFKP